MTFSSMLFLQRAGVPAPARALAARGAAGMVGMRRHAGPRLHPEAPSSLLGHQQRLWTAWGRPGGGRLLLLLLGALCASLRVSKHRRVLGRSDMGSQPPLWGGVGGERRGALHRSDPAPAPAPAPASVPVANPPLPTRPATGDNRAPHWRTCASPCPHPIIDFKNRQQRRKHRRSLYCLMGKLPHVPRAPCSSAAHRRRAWCTAGWGGGGGGGRGGGGEWVGVWGGGGG